MPQYKSSASQFWFEVGGEPEDTFQLLEFYGAEAISQLFRFEVKLIAPIDSDLNLPDFLNKPAKLIILRDDEKKELHGILSDLEEVGRNKDFAQYHGILVPRLWQLSLFYQSRVFQNQSVPDIIKNVLKDAGLGANDFSMQLKRSYSAREYCVQYRETDLNFISRLMEYEGIYYFFDHADGKDSMVIVDDKSGDPMIDAPDDIKSYVGEGYETEEEEVVSELTWHERVVTGKVVLKDYNYRTPETTLSADSQIDSKSPGLYYEYGEHFKTASDGKTLAKIRNEEIEACRRVISGSGNCRGFHAGYKFTLSKHYRSSLNGDYLMTQCSHMGSQGGGVGAAGGAAGAGPSYKNQFACIPADVQYRPPRITPEPRIPGVMTAKIETAGGDYAHIDDEGRYFVKMPFDLSSKGNAGASRAIRMAQPYSGADYGIHFPNRANTEMVWACVDGNVDRPLGLSTVPNPSNKSPSVAGNKPQCVIRTAGKNELTFDDMIGSENIYLHGTKNWTIDIAHDKHQTIGNDETASVGHDRSRKVSNDEKIEIGNNRSESVGKNQDESIGDNSSVTVGKDLTESIGANSSVTVGKNLTESIGENRSTSVGKNQDESIGENLSASVGKDLSESVGKNKSVSVGEKLTEDIGKDMSVQVGKNYSCQIGENATIQIGKKTQIQSGDDLAIAVDKKAVISAEDQLTLKCGDASITMKKNGDITIKGNKINIKGSGDVTIKGSKIAEN